MNGAQDKRQGVGLDYADQRYYGSGVGRFLTSDPYQASGGASQPGSWNRYAYVEADPVNYNDASGLLKEQIVVESGVIFRTTTTARGYSGQLEGDVLLALQARGNRTDTFGSQPRKTLAESLEETYGVSELCARGMAASGARMDAIDRANEASNVLKEAAEEADIAWRLLAAIGVRESGFKNIDEIGGGPGRGIFQVTPNKGISEAQARDLSTAARYAAKHLKGSINHFSAVIDEYGRNPWAVAARGYNTGTSNRYTLNKLIGDDYIGNLDRGTARNNYVTSVLNLMDCFY